MGLPNRIWSGTLLALAAVVVVDALAILIIIAAPESDLGRWLSRHEPVFNLLIASDARTPETPKPVVPPAVERTVRIVQGPHYLILTPGHPIFAGPGIESGVRGAVQKNVRLKVEEEQDGWYRLSFSFGEGWIHPFVTAKFLSAETRDRVEPLIADAGSADGEPGTMQVEMRVEADDGRRPDAIYFENLAEQRRPLLFTELLSDYDPSDLAALPPGTDPARLQLATQLLGDRPKQARVGDFILRYQDDRWAGEARRALTSLRETYQEAFADILDEGRIAHVAYLFLLPNMDRYRDFYPDARTTGTIQTAGHYEGGIIAIHPDVADGGNHERTLVHEAVHHYNNILLGINGNPALTWLDEGLATYFGLSRIDGDGNLHPGEFPGNTVRIRVDPQARNGLLLNTGSPEGRIYLLQRELNGGMKIDLNAFLAKHGEEFYTGNILSNYSLAWMLVHFMMHADAGAYRGAFLTYVDEAREGEVPPARLAELAGLSMENLQNKLRAWILMR